MKKKMLTLGAVLALVAVLVAPNAVLAATTTAVTGNVTEGYTFSAPSPVALGDMDPSATPSIGSSTDGSLEGNNSGGYTVTGIDAKGTNTGKMVSGTTPLTNMLQIGPAANDLGPAATAKEFLSTGGVTDATIALHVSQTVEFTDTVADNYTITITFTVTPK